MISNFSDNEWTAVSKESKYGVINTTGKVIIPLIYDQVTIFSKETISE